MHVNGSSLEGPAFTEGELRGFHTTLDTLKCVVRPIWHVCDEAVCQYGSMFK